MIVRSLVEKTVDTYGRLDYAVNNAGIGEKMTPLVEQTSEKFDQIMNTNVRGVWLSMKYEIPVMTKNGGGAIVNTSSGAGLVGFPQMSSLCREQTCRTRTDQVSCARVCQVRNHE